MPQYDHVFVIVMENHSYDEIVPNTTDAPYLSSLATVGANATNYHGVAHPSEPNYLALVAGSTLGVTDDAWHTQSAATLADRLEAAGKDWRTYSQGQGSDPTIDLYPYAVKHNPLAFFTQTDKSKLEPMDALSSDLAHAPAFALLVPDLLHDMHDGSIADGDAYVRQLMQTIQSSPAWTQDRSLVVVTFDEDGSSRSNTVPCILVAKDVRPGSYDTWWNHYSLLRSIEEALGVPDLGANDRSATDMSGVSGS